MGESRNLVQDYAQVYSRDLQLSFPISIQTTNLVPEELHPTNNPPHPVVIPCGICPAQIHILTWLTPSAFHLGAGYHEMRMIERLTRGLWIPGSNEFLQPTL